MDDDFTADPVAARAVRTFRLLGETAYLEFGATVGWLTSDGGPMPLWADLDERQRAAWIRAAGAVFARLHEPDGDVA